MENRLAKDSLVRNLAKFLKIEDARLDNPRIECWWDIHGIMLSRRQVYSRGLGKGQEESATI